MNSKLKEDLLEYEDTTEDTKISDGESLIIPFSKCKNFTYNDISNVNNLISNKDNSVDNIILQQRENRRIIFLIKKILQQKDDIDLAKAKIIELLKKYKYKNNIIYLRDDKRDTLLHIYVKANDIISLNIILDIYIDILGISEKFFDFLFLKNIQGFTVFDLSAQFEYIPIIKLLYNQLEKVEDYHYIINYIEYLKNNIFNISSENNKIFPIIFFFEKLRKFYQTTTINLLDCEDERLNKDGMTPILYASKNRNLKLVLILIDLGANINSQNNDGKTALHFAVLNNDERMVKHLLIRGADKFLKDKDNNNAYNLAVSLKHENLIKILYHKNFCQRIFCGGELGQLPKYSTMIPFISYLIFNITVYIVIFIRFFVAVNDTEVDLSSFSLKLKKKFEINEILTCLDENCISEITFLVIFLAVDLLLLTDIIIFKFSKKVFLPKKSNVEEKLSKLYEMNENVCIKCGIPKNQKTKHCIVCNRCVANWDHHCYWLNTCINDKNFCKFKLFIILCFSTLISNLLFYIYSIYLIISAKDSFFQEILNLEKSTLIYYLVVISLISVFTILIIIFIYLLLLVNLPMFKYICIMSCKNKQELDNIEIIIDSDDSFNKIFEEKD